MPETVIRVCGPLPMDVAGTLLNVIGTVYPGALVRTSDMHPRDALVMVVPDSERPGLPLPEGHAALEVVGLDAEGLRLATPSEILAPLAAYVDEQFEANPEAENYLEQTVTTADRRRYVLTFRRAEGKTPHEMRRAAEAERDALRDEVEQLRAKLEGRTQSVE